MFILKFYKYYHLNHCYKKSEDILHFYESKRRFKFLGLPFSLKD